MSAEQIIELAGISFVAALTFWLTWKKWDDGRDAENMDEDVTRFMGVEFKRGFDGKRHMKSMPRHVRLALSLISGLFAAIVALLYFRWTA